MAEIRVHKYDDGGWCEQTYEGDLLHGTWTVYYPNGQKSWECAYLRGAKHGFCRKWNKCGQLIEEECYWFNALHGRWREWDNNGIEHVIGDFQFGYKVSDLECSENRNFQTLLKPFLAYEPATFEALIPELRQKWTRQKLLLIKDEQPSRDLTERISYWNHINVMRADETWPHYQDKPLFPILQIRCDEAVLPGHPLSKFAYVTLFSIADDTPFDLGDDIVVRAYKNSDELVAAKSPIGSLEPPCRIQFTGPLESFPDPNDFPPGLSAYLKASAKPDVGLEASDRFATSWGGWPEWLQWGKIGVYGDFVFQVDRLDIQKWRVGHNAMLYFFFHESSNTFSYRFERM